MLAIKYTAFAILATAVNLMSQFLTLTSLESLIGSKSALLFCGLVVGTASGLVVKYYLDKKHIFYYETANALEDAKKFSMYSLVGLFTTAIFWGFEIVFSLLFEADYALYIGGALGLCIGYVIKYQIDKRLVFVSR